MNKKASTPKGTRDFSSVELYRRDYILKTVKSAFERYSYTPIETPAMENISTLTGKYGDDGDKLIFRILNSGNFLTKVDANDFQQYKSIRSKISDKALRYDLTVPFARYVAQNRNNIIFPFKRYQMQNVWRADKPQKGRFREFFQCDADFIGTESLICEVELIQLYDEIFTCLEIPNVKICISNRKILTGMIELMGATEFFDDIVVLLDKIDLIGLNNIKEQLLKKGISSNSLSILDDFLNIEKVSDLSSLLNSSNIGKKGIDELEFIIQTISELGLKSTNLVFDISLARGIDYYTGTILEVKCTDVEIGSIGGGGRYDNLTKNFGIENLSGVGISLGIDRIYIILDELDLFPKESYQKNNAMFVNFGETEVKYSLQVLKKLRSIGITCEIYPTDAKLKKQMSYANNKGVKYVVLIGENEITSAKFKVKNMFNGEQKNLTIDQLIKELK